MGVFLQLKPNIKAGEARGRAKLGEETAVKRTEVRALQGIGVGIAGGGDEVGPSQIIGQRGVVILDLFAERLGEGVVVLQVAKQRLERGWIEGRFCIVVSRNLLIERADMDRELVGRLPKQG